MQVHVIRFVTFVTVCMSRVNPNVRSWTDGTVAPMIPQNPKEKNMLVEEPIEHNYIANESIVPLPPSLKPLVGLKETFVAGIPPSIDRGVGLYYYLECEQNSDVTTSPTTYVWYHSKKLNGQRDELTVEKKDYNYTMKNISWILYFVSENRRQLYLHKLHTNYLLDNDGFYWCEAENENGFASTNKILVVHVKYFLSTNEYEPQLANKTIKSGQSSRIGTYRENVAEDEMPFPVEIRLKFDANRKELHFEPRHEFDGKEGRLVIGDDFDLYVLEAEESDSLKLTQDLYYRQPQPGVTIGDSTIQYTVYRNLTVEKTTYEGPPQTGFFEGYADYVYKEGDISGFTCIPKKVGKVTFKKDGKEIEDLTENEDEDVFRSRYGLWFKKADVSHAGTYTCHLEGDTATLTKTVKVVGPPKITCNYDFYLIKTPGDPFEINCEVTSDMYAINEPELYFNNQLFDNAKEENKKISFEKTVNPIKDGYNIIVSSEETNKEHDTGVIRFSVEADQIDDRTSFLEKLGFSSPFDKVQLFHRSQFFRFDCQKEVAVAVFKMPAGIKWNNRLDMLVGESFSVTANVYGSPLPVVSWFVDGGLNSEIDITYRYPYDYLFYIKEVQKSHTLTVEGKQLQDGEAKRVFQSFQLKAHEPLTWSPGLVEEVKAVVGTEATASCSVTQKKGTHTSDIDFSWTYNDGQGVFDGQKGFNIERSEVVGDGEISYTSSLKITGIKHSEFTFFCYVTLKADGFQIQRLSHQFKIYFGVVEVGKEFPSTKVYFYNARSSGIYKNDSERYGPENLYDEDLSTDIDSGGCFHSQSNLEPSTYNAWVQLDSNETAVITKVYILNRMAKSNEAHKRIKGLKVEVCSDSSKNNCEVFGTVKDTTNAYWIEVSKETPIGLEGATVLLKHNQIINICEVLVGKRISLESQMIFHNARSSGIYKDDSERYGPQNLYDGDTRTDINSGSCFHSQSKLEPSIYNAWVQLDSNEAMFITNIYILNRNAKYEEPYKRIMGMTVEVCSNSSKIDCEVFGTVQVAPDANWLVVSKETHVGLEGATVLLKHTQIINICEVLVEGQKIAV